VAAPFSQPFKNLKKIWIATTSVEELIKRFEKTQQGTSD
jgi:hypothetical protein